MYPLKISAFYLHSKRHIRKLNISAKYFQGLCLQKFSKIFCTKNFRVNCDIGVFDGVDFENPVGFFEIGTLAQLRALSCHFLGKSLKNIKKTFKTLPFRHFSGKRRSFSKSTGTIMSDKQYFNH